MKKIWDKIVTANQRKANLYVARQLAASEYRGEDVAYILHRMEQGDL